MTQSRQRSRRLSRKQYFADPELRDGEVAAWGRHLEDAGWRRTTDSDWQLYLAYRRPSDDFYAALRPGQWVNSFPGMAAYGVKSCLAENLAAAKLALAQRGGDGELFGFHPRTFLLPDDLDDWRQLAEQDPSLRWLLKPKASSRGRGISLITDLDAVPGDGDWLVQEYISSPHLIDGFKYGLRFYVLVTSLEPLICYVHQVGTCRVATRPYSLDTETLDDPVVHLTNTAIQQTNSDAAWWLRNTGLDDYRLRLRAQGVDDQALFAKIHHQLTRTMIACREQALIESRAATGATGASSGCFEFLGVDFQIDDQMEPWLLECNPSPPMEDEGGYDEATGARFQAIKDALMSDTISLLGLSEDDPATSGDGLQRAQNELARARGWRRLWPDENAHRFVDCFPLLRPSDRLVAARICPSLSTENPTPRPAPHVETLPLADGLALYDSYSGGLHALNDSAAAVWLGLLEGDSVEQAIDEVRTAVEQASGRSLPRQDLESEIWDLMVAWAQRGLLSGFERAQIAACPPRDEISPTRFEAYRRGDLLLVPLDPTLGNGWPEAWTLDEIQLPASGIRRLALVDRIGPKVSTQRVAVEPSACLDSLALVADRTLFPNVATAVAWTTWIESLELFHLDLSTVDSKDAGTPGLALETLLQSTV